MALVAGTRAVIGRASTMTAMAAIATSSSSTLSVLSSPLPSPRPSSSDSTSSSKSSAIPSRLRVMRCQRLLLFSSKVSSKAAAVSPSRSISTSIAASSSSSSATSIETSDASPSPASSSPPPPPPQPSGGESTPAAAVEVDALDIRVGRVLKAWRHPEADSLYVEEVDLAEAEGPRTICSGLVNYMPLEELQGRAVLVLANLKPRNMRGVKSNGMLLAASNAEHTVVQLLSPPEEAATGERVWFGEETDQATQPPAETANKVQKKKIWETVQPLLKTTEDCMAVFQSMPMRTSGGVVTCQSLPGANIS